MRSWYVDSGRRLIKLLEKLFWHQRLSRVSAHPDRRGFDTVRPLLHSTPGVCRSVTAPRRTWSTYCLCKLRSCMSI